MELPPNGLDPPNEGVDGAPNDVVGAGIAAGGTGATVAGFTVLSAFAAATSAAVGC